MNTVYRDLLDETIGSEPPSRLDLESLVSGLQRRARLRRWAAVGTCAAAVGLLGLAAGLAPDRQSLSEPGSGPTSAPMNVPVPTSRPTFAGPPPTEPASAAKDRLGEAMRAAVLRAVPGAVLGGDFDIQHLAAESEPNDNGRSWTAPMYTFQSQQAIEVDGVRGVVTVSVHRLAFSDACLVPLGPGSVKSCEQGPGPNGELVIVERLVDEDANGTLLRTIVRVERPDGSAVWVIISNETQLSSGLRPMAYTGQSPPLSVVQLTAIALDPTLTIYP